MRKSAPSCTPSRRVGASAARGERAGATSASASSASVAIKVCARFMTAAGVYGASTARAGPFSAGPPRATMPAMAPRLVIVFVVDGLRPDGITIEDTPTLARLCDEGVRFADSHAVFPTVTRVNAATLATGTQPGTHGI